MLTQGLLKGTQLVGRGSADVPFNTVTSGRDIAVCAIARAASVGENG